MPGGSPRPQARAVVGMVGIVGSRRRPARRRRSPRRARAPDAASAGGPAIAIGAITVLLVLLLVANGTPVVLTRLLGGRGAYPIDGGRRWRDGRPLLGRSKTWRGLVGAVAATTLAGWLLGVGAGIGAVVALTALAGDAASSFTKRRLGVASSGPAFGLDQVPESLLPALVVARPLGLGVIDVLAVTVTFFVGELVLSRLLYHLKIRDRPY